MPAPGRVDHLNVECAALIGKQVVALVSSRRYLMVEARWPDAHKERRGGHRRPCRRTPLGIARHPHVKRDPVQPPDGDSMALTDCEVTLPRNPVGYRCRRRPDPVHMALAIMCLCRYPRLKADEAARDRISWRLGTRRLQQVQARNVEVVRPSSGDAEAEPRTERAAGVDASGENTKTCPTVRNRTPMRCA